MIDLLTALIALAVGVLVGFLLSAWWAERGRNRDLRELARLQLEREQPATRVLVRDGSSGEMVEVGGEEAKEPMLTDDERERMVADLMEESPVAMTRSEARTEVDRILKKASALGQSG